MNCKALIALVLISAGLSRIAMADTVIRDLGTTGATYPVVEPDLIAELQQESIRLNEMKSTAQLLEQMKTYQPANLYKLPHATANRTFLVNLDYSVDHDVVDGEGNVLYPQGTTFNPLDYISFPGGLVVIDGKDPLQLSWFQSTPYADNQQARLLLSEGYAYELTRQLQRQVYYLTADIAKRLQLTAVPAVVVQDGRKLRVDELKIDLDKQEAVDEQH